MWLPSSCLFFRFPPVVQLGVDSAQRRWLVRLRQPRQLLHERLRVPHRQGILLLTPSLSLASHVFPHIGSQWSTLLSSRGGESSIRLAPLFLVSPLKFTL